MQRQVTIHACTLHLSPFSIGPTPHHPTPPHCPLLSPLSGDRVSKGGVDSLWEGRGGGYCEGVLYCNGKGRYFEVVWCGAVPCGVVLKLQSKRGLAARDASWAPSRGEGREYYHVIVISSFYRIVPVTQRRNEHGTKTICLQNRFGKSVGLGHKNAFPCVNPAESAVYFVGFKWYRPRLNTA